MYMTFIFYSYVLYIFAVSSPVGEVDWNIRRQISIQKRGCVFPCGGSGLKFPGIIMYRNGLTCLPLWGKWIEIALRGRLWNWEIVSSPVGEVDWNVNARANVLPSICVFPCGGSGLKYDFKGISMREDVCLPLWGKWIEMGLCHILVAWHSSVFPCGGSGLKFCRHVSWLLHWRVFPCGGSGLKSPYYVRENSD